MGNLLLRTVNRAQRIHLAMNCRGFDGEIRIMNSYSSGYKEIAFFTGWCSLFLLFRFVNLSQLTGMLFMGFLS